jgi:hypothetical protein
MPTKKTATKKATKTKKVAKKSTKKAAKKTTKKKTTKSTKKTARKKASAKPLVQATDEQSFWVADGQILNSLVALHDALDAMKADVFKYHATGEQNDFANWVEVVLCDADCAADLRQAKTKRSAKTVVVKHLKFYAV